MALMHIRENLECNGKDYSEYDLPDIIQHQEIDNDIESIQGKDYVAETLYWKQSENLNERYLKKKH